MTIRSVETEAQVHLLAIRKALANRNAAVMVGAGFSRNAEGGQNLATWRQLSEALAIELEPGIAPGEFAPAAVSQLAEQYARVFSPTHLEQLIKRCVPDDQVTPGRLHTLLLELPWSDVFTTNYDTLLERAAERLFDSSYFTVCAREDIPQSKVLGRRRIVKLHGTFPSHRPFILTEEEYRTYPERFAPFVNLVRQSLLENVFCLIGFSGDDPNFLHWIGWVRDMLDKHALPVYLFLAKEPTLGERKLYEARGVVPVVLPTPQGVSTSDYQTRYRALFTELARPLADSPLDWRDFSKPADGNLQWDTGNDQQLVQLMQQLPALTAYRRSYPGWLVAPQKIRVRFRRTAEWLERALLQRELRTLLAQRPASVILALIEVYGWAQCVMLQPWNDDIAELGRAALLVRNSSKSALPTSEEMAFLSSMGCADAATEQITWVNVGLALLTWARQGHRTMVYDEIRAQLQSFAPEDATVQDRLTYEDILLHLQRGDQLGALQKVVAWRPKGSDAYVHVLRGSLLAEAGETVGALQVLEQAIQVLRRQQRSRPGDPALISQEAWACLVARNVQRAQAFGFRFSNPSLAQSDRETGESEGEDFEQRLNALGARGYSAGQELESLIAELNAEAQPPQITARRLQGFDLGGGSSRMHMMPRRELSDKITASLAWLELVERTGLPAQTKNANFFVDQMLQAAWWSRFADTPQRSIGLLLRAHRENALDARDRSLPPHRSGWLGRHEVARFTAQSAEELCAELMKQICSEFEGARAPAESKSRAIFLLKVFSHLVVRVCSEINLANWGKQLLELHNTTAVRADTALWDPLSRALGRILEALPGPVQSPLILQASSLTLIPTAAEGRVTEHELFRWLNLNLLFKHWDPDANERSGAEWRPIAQKLIQQLRLQLDTQGGQQIIWHRLIALNEKGLLSDAEQKEIGNMLWEGADHGRWPVIPGYLLTATLLWPAPRRNVASLLLNRLLDRPFRPFNSGGYMQMTVGEGRRSYQIGGLEESLGTIQRAMREATPTLPQIEKLVEAVNGWLDEQLEDIILDLGNEQLHDEVFSAIGFLDNMLAQCVNQLAAHKQTPRVRVLLGRIDTLDNRLQALAFPRFHLSLALIRSEQRSEQALDDHLRSLIGALTADSEQVLWRAANAAYALLKEDNPRFFEAAKMLFDAVVACVFTQRATCMAQTMNLLANLPPSVWNRNLDQKSLNLLDIALADLVGRLAYDRQVPADSISDESVPILRYRVFELAYSLVHVAEADATAAQRWLDAAADDPLPEVRLGRFKVGKGKS